MKISVEIIVRYNVQFQIWTTLHNTLLQTPEYDEWVKNESPRSQVQINKRLAMIEFEEYFGDHRSVSFYEKTELKGLIWELRWKDGRRIYYAYIPEKKILFLLGGNKNGQNKDIAKAKALYLKSTKK